MTKCPFINSRKACGFNNRKYRGDCPLLVRSVDTNEEVECFDLPEKDYNLMMRYKK